MENLALERTEREKNIWLALEQVPDPEIPVISVVDLGIITRVEESEGNVRITMTPTFSGCPAIKYMKDQIQKSVSEMLQSDRVEVVVDYSVQWSSNLISEKGREALKNFGLAPPKRYEKDLNVNTIAQVNCPWCGSENTTMNSPFGSTLCRAIHYCFDCLQGFEQFKPV